MDSRYYVYLYLDVRKPGDYYYDNLKFNFEPMYVGKGARGRYLHHLCKAEGKSYCGTNRYLVNKIRKIIKINKKPIILKLKEGLLDKDAKNLEITIIGKIGRLDLSTGPLLNNTNGGDGAGFIHTKDMNDRQSVRSKSLWKDSRYINSVMEGSARTRKTERYLIFKDGTKKTI